MEHLGSRTAEVSHLGPYPAVEGPQRGSAEVKPAPGTNTEGNTGQTSVSGKQPAVPPFSPPNPPPQSLVIRLVLKQLKCSNKPKGALIRDECAPACVIDQLFQHIGGGGLQIPSLLSLRGRARLRVQLPPARPTSADVPEWTLG